MHQKSTFTCWRTDIFLTNFLIFTLFTNVQSTCPEKCSCYFDQPPITISCSGQGLTEFPKNLSDLVEYLNLSENLISEIPDEINGLSELQDLNLSQNILNSLPSNLQGLQKLQKLILTGNNLNDTNEISSLNQLSSLNILNLSHNPISDLNGLENENLQALDASHCAIKEMDSTFLQGFPNLTRLSLAGNSIKNIQGPVHENLHWLNLSNCDLHYLSADTFEGLSKLEDLLMQNNKYLTYSTRKETLRHNNLRRLDVTNCNLDRPGLHEFPLLTYAKLTHNGIHILPDRIFARNKALTHLYLDSNRLDHLNKSSFAGLTELQVLDLSENSLNEVHWSVFQDNMKLSLLNLSVNRIQDFSNLTTSSETVDLSSNMITKIDSNALINMPRIKALNLSNNFLEDFSSLESKTLRILELRRNRLVELNAYMVVGLPELVKLDLFGNRLTEGPNPDIFQNNQELRILSLADNPWRCSCYQLHPIQKFLMQLPVKTEMWSLICQSPNNVSGYSWETACDEEWFGAPYKQNNRTWGLVMVSILTFVIVGGTIFSIRNAMKTKRTARNQRQQLERAEARERLRLLQRRNQRLEEELREQTSDPRIHPMELTGPPSYEEAVQMPRLAQSLDGLDVASTENATITRVLGSVDNLRVKKRRPRRPRKRTISDENLTRREERRVERIRQKASRIIVPSNHPNADQSPESVTELPPPSAGPAVNRIRSDSDQAGTDSPIIKMRPPTPLTKKKRRIIVSKAGTSTDDEDSDFQNTPNRSSIRNTIIITNLPREPRSGFRPPSTTDNASG